MLTRSLGIGVAALAAWAAVLGAASDAAAQWPVYYPAPAAVGYAPEIRGLFGRRLVYRPVVAAPVAFAPVVAPIPVAAPVPVVRAPVTAFYAPGPVAVASYYAPSVPMVGAPVRVTTYYAPRRVVVPPVVTYYPPLIVP
jgi:hypothetical protein